MIHVVADITVHPGKRDEFLKHFHELVPKVHAEEGCVEYGPTVDLPTNLPVQPPVRENVVTVIEKWEDLPALEAHLIAPHMVEYREIVKNLVVDTKVCVLTPA